MDLLEALVRVGAEVLPVEQARVRAGPQDDVAVHEDVVEVPPVGHLHGPGHGLVEQAVAAPGP